MSSRDRDDASGLGDREPRAVEHGDAKLIFAERSDGQIDRRIVGDGYSSGGPTMLRSVNLDGKTSATASDSARTRSLTLSWVVRA